MVVNGIRKARHERTADLAVNCGETVRMFLHQRVHYYPYGCSEFAPQAHALAVVPAACLRDIAAGREPVDNLHFRLLRFPQALLDFVPRQAFRIGLG